MQKIVLLIAFPANKRIDISILPLLSSAFGKSRVFGQAKFGLAGLNHFLNTVLVLEEKKKTKKKTSELHERQVVN